MGTLQRTSPSTDSDNSDKPEKKKSKKKARAALPTGLQRYLDRHQAASYAAMSVAALDRLAAEIGFSRVGRRVVYSVADIDAFLAKKRERPIVTSRRGAEAA